MSLIVFWQKCTISTEGRRGLPQLSGTGKFAVHVDGLLGIGRHVILDAPRTRDIYELMVSAEKSFKIGDVFNVYQLLKLVPERLMSLVWAGEQEIVDVYCQEEATLRNPVAAGMPIDRDASKGILENPFEVCLPMSSRLWMSVEGLNEAHHRPFVLPLPARRPHFRWKIDPGRMLRLEVRLHIGLHRVGTRSFIARQEPIGNIRVSSRDRRW